MKFKSELSKNRNNLLAAFLMAACFFNPASSVAENKKNEELKIGINQEYETLNPALGSTAAAKYMWTLSYRSLVFLDENNKWQTHAVKKIPNLKDKSLKMITEKNGEKSLIAEWEFKEEAKWADGVPMTCKDLKLSWDIGLNPMVSIGNREPFESIKSIEWNDKTPKKCTIKYKTAKWTFFQDTPDPIPAHIEQEILNKWGKEKEGYDRNTLYQKDPTIKGLWNGPYVISEAKLGSHLIFTENPNFWGKKPNIKKIVMRIIPNGGTLEANLRSKNIDLISRIGMSLDQAMAFEQKVKSENLPYDVIYQNGITYAHIDINLDHPILKELAVRKALSYGTNKVDIIKSIFDGKVTLAHHSISPLDSLYTEDKTKVSIYEYDKKKAKKILDDAGWKLGADGFRTKNNQKLTFKLVGASGVKQIETLQTILQSQWKDLGVDLQIKTEPGRLLFSDTLNHRKFDMAVFSWISFPGQSPESTFHSKNIPSEKNSWSGQNYTGFNSPEVDKLIHEYEHEFNETKRKTISNKIMKEYTGIIPVLPLYFRGENAINPKGMKGFKLTGHLFYETNKAEYWEL